MSKQYCFDIDNPNNIDYDPAKLKIYIRGLYVGRGKTKFNKDKIPFSVIYTPADVMAENNHVCIYLTVKGKKNISRIEKINETLKPDKLKWKGLILSKPHEFFIEGKPGLWAAKPTKRQPGQFWASMAHRGPYFAHISEPYIPVGGFLTYDGKKYPLNPREEKVAMLYAKRIITDRSPGSTVELTKDAKFNENFWHDFKRYLTPQHLHVFQNFKKIGWEDLVEKFEAKRLANKQRSEQQKKIIKERGIERKQIYSYAKLDGIREQISNPVVEPMALFEGRAKNPNRGKIKEDVYPEDVTINIGRNDPIPPPPAGHKWKQVIHNHHVRWLYSWKHSVTGNLKHVYFATKGRFKGEADLRKYEKARKLQRHITHVRAIYERDAQSSSPIKKQLGTVLWLIDHHGVRPGDERDAESQADTVGASTLRVDQVKLQHTDKIKFEFLGKDSIEFKKTMTVPKFIYANFKEFTAGRPEHDQVFNRISAASINQYLKQFDVDFSSKVFRTRLGSHIMFEALKKVKLSKKLPPKKNIKMRFNKANIKVANVLNHTRTLTTRAQDALKKLRDKLKKLKEELKLAKKSGKKTTRLEKSITSAKDSLRAKSDTQAVALNTSLLNYIDPRIVVSWAERQGNGQDIKRTQKIISSVYSATMQATFQWAIQNTPRDWNWMTSPLVDNPNLVPDSKLKKRRKSKSRLKKKRAPEPKISQKDLREWCRRMYGPNWFKTDKKKRLADAHTDLSKKSRRNPRPRPHKRPIPTPVRSTDEDYEKLLEFCRKPLVRGKRNTILQKLTSHIGIDGKFTYPALDWVYPFTVYAIQNGIGNQQVVIALNRWYAAVYEIPPTFRSKSGD